MDVVELPGEIGGHVNIIFHGFGADAMDLVGISHAIKPQPGTTWIFPDGIQSMADIYGQPGYPGRAWWPIDVTALEAAMAQGGTREMSNMVPPGIDELRGLVMDMIYQLDRPLDKITLGGFSQGAMLATDVCLNMATNPAGLVLLSGTLLNENKWSGLAKNHKGLEFFQSHGRNDPLLGFGAAKKLNELLNAAGLKGTLHDFSGGHEIPQSIIFELQNYLLR